MKASEDLFELVESTTAAERRKFRQQAHSSTNSGDELYLRLFDILIKMDTYDESKVKAHFAGEPCLRQFTRLKNYLYEALLQSLQEGRRDREIAMRVRADLDKVQLLIEKALITQAAKRLRRCKSMVRQYDFTTLLPQVLQFERQILKKLRDKSLLTQLQALETQEQACCDNLQTEFQAYAAHDRLLQDIYQHANARNSATPITIPATSATPTTFNGRLAHLLRQALAYRHQGDRPQAHQQYQEILEHWQASPHQIKAAPDRYEKAIAAFLFSAHSIGEYSAHTQLLESIRESVILSPALKANIRCMSYNLRLLYLMNTRKFAEARALAPEMAAELSTARVSNSPWLPAATNLALLYFLLEDHSAARHWCNRILDMPRDNVRRDLKALVRTLHLLMLYEQQEWELIPYFLKSLQRYIRRQRPLNGMELALGRFLQEGLRARNTAEKQAALQRLSTRLDKPDLTKATIGLEELKMWANSRLKGEKIQV